MSDNRLVTVDYMMSLLSRREMVRGKSLGSQLTLEQIAAITDGTFDDLFLGDYWERNGVRWRIVDFNYYAGLQDAEGNIVGPHIIVMPDNRLYLAKMNSTRTTEGAYASAGIRETGLAQAAQLAESVFEGHVIRMRDFLSTAMTDEFISAASFRPVYVELPSEIMMYGFNLLSKRSDGAIRQFSTLNIQQLALLRHNPTYIRPQDGSSMWLRDPVSSTQFASLSPSGLPTPAFADNNYGIRPIAVIG